MSAPPTYELSIRAETPDTVVEGEPFEVTYYIKNVGSSIFPGGIFVVKVSWPSLGPNIYVTHPINVSRPLSPNKMFNASKKKRR